MLNLGRGISEYEDRTAIPLLWEPHEKFVSIFKEDYYIISGKKGSGKSTIVDYKQMMKKDNEIIIIIRPTEDDELYERVKEIAFTSKLNYAQLRQALSKLFEFVSLVLTMKELIAANDEKPITGNLATISKYLANNNLRSGSTIKKTLDVLSELTQDFVKLGQLFSLLQKAEGPTYQEARDAMFAHIKDNYILVYVFIDDIDGYGFEYGPENKAFLDALVINTMNINTLAKRKGINFRVIVTPPTELFDNAYFWNKDKIFTKTIFLRWAQVEKLQNLINKRISAELNIKNRKRTDQHDIYSVDTYRTWESIFPAIIKNRIDGSERTIDYIIRHTFYTPRAVLAICQACLEYLEERGFCFETIKNVSDYVWSEAIQSSCEEKSNEISQNVTEIYNSMYTGFTELLEDFEGRPNIWSRRILLTFIRERHLGKIKSNDTGKAISIDDIVKIMYSIGFIGYGFHSTTLSPTGSNIYDIFFSYIKWTTRSVWNVAVISPVFYDYYRIAPIKRIVVTPIDRLRLPHNIVDEINNYDCIRNIL
jgi:hypothetical protein